MLCSGFLATSRGEAPAVARTGAFQKGPCNFDLRHAAAYAREMQLWDSRNGPGGTGRLDYGPFKANQSLELMIAGFPGTPGESLKLVSGSAELTLQPTACPGTYWTRYRWDLPKEWVGRLCHLVAEDNSTEESAGWLGVSSPLKPTGQYARAIVESLLQALICILILIPGYAVVVFLPRLKPLQALAWLFTSTALLSHLVFFCYFASPLFGQICSLLIYAGAMACLVAKRREFAERLCQFDFVFPQLFAIAIAILYFAGGFLYGGIDSPEGVSVSRFLAGMPPDPLLPYWFARILVAGSPLHPFSLDWLTSDRPPLQTGLYLLSWPFTPTRFDYEVVGIAAQTWVWGGLWFFLRQRSVSRRATAFVLATAAFSGMFFFNTFFCWPKLLPAAFLLLVAGSLWGGENSSPPDFRTIVFASVCAGLAMLGHGGSAFGLAGIGIVYLVERRKSDLRVVAFGLGTLLLVLTPWTLYQKLVDPPGDRLIKFHLAGHKDVDLRSSLEVIREAYGQITWQEAVHNKLANVRMLLCGSEGQPVPAVLESARYEFAGNSPPVSKDRLRGALRLTQFFHYFQAPGLFILGLLGLLRFGKSPSPEKTAAFLALRFFLCSALVWCALMFEPGSTSIHQSSYFTGACLFAAAGLGLSLLPPAVSLVVSGLGVVSFYWLWMSGPCDPAPGEITPGLVPGFGFVVGLSSAAVLGLLLAAAFPAEKPLQTARGFLANLGDRLAAWTLPAFLKNPVVVVVAAMTILVARKTDSLTNPQLWAEDGLVFFMGAYEHGLAVFSQVYAGYLHTVPRLVAWASLSLDPAWIPTAYNYSAFLIQVLVIAAVFSKRIRLPAKPCIALCLALVPHTGEVFFNLTNVQWILAVGFVLLLLADDPTRSTHWIVDGLTVFLAGLTGPFSVFFLPVFALRAFLRKSRASIILLALVALTAGIQASFLFVHRDEFARTTAYDFPRLISCLGVRHWGTFWAGYDIPFVYTSAGWLFLAAVGLAATAYLSLRPGPWRHQRLMLGAVWLCCSVPVAARFAREAWVIGSVELGDRYFFHPHLVFAWLLVLLAVETDGWKRKLAFCLLGAAVVGNLPFMKANPLIDYHWKDSVQPIREGKPFNIPINPEGFGVSSPGHGK